MSTMVKIVCARCALGDVDASPERIGWGICCAPPPHIAAQIAAQAAARLQDALSAAESSDIVLADPATPAEGAEGVCERLRRQQRRIAGRATTRRGAGDPPGPLTWLVPSPRAVAHLFAPGAPRSRCGQVHRELHPGDDRLQIAPPGRRGCRPCAVSAGLIDTIAEGVTV